jgi:plasmid stability protein
VPAIVIRKIDETVKARLRLQAARHGRSMEEEARAILKAGLRRERVPKQNLASAIRRHFAPLGGIELTLPPRERVRQPPRLSS